MIYRSIPGQVATGYRIGMLCGEWNIPFIPGDLNNANTFEFPVLYARVPGADGASILGGSPERHTEKFIAAARQLEQAGVQAITSNCGYMIAYQQAITEAVSIPVFMSSLLQAPLLLSMFAPDAKIGALVANGAAFTDVMLCAAGVADPSRVAVHGLETGPLWRATINEEHGTLDSDGLRAEVVAAALSLQQRTPGLRAILLECSDLPPYAADIEKATGLPVFDWASFIRWVHAACAPRRYPEQ